MNRTHRTFRFFATGLGLGILLTVFAFSITHHAARPTPRSAKAVEGTLTISGTSQSVTGDLTAARLLDQANTAYLIDPAASGTSLATAGTATIAGTLTLGNAALLRPAFGPLKLDYKSGLDAWTTALTIQDTTGNVGIGTTAPGTKLAVAGTVESTTGGFKFPDGTTQTGAASGAGTTSCPTGYILVPGSATFGTNDFCVMKYEAKQDADKNPASTATGTPWVSVDWYEAKTACGRDGGHLVTNAEWMTIARNIESTTINDMDDDAGVQLATGHSDSAPAAAQAATAGSDPVVSGCNLSATMENAANAYSASSCEIRGDGSYTGDDNDKGFYGTSQAWSTTGYSAGAANKSQLRTHVLSNGSVIWDVAGNVWEWSDWQCSTGVWYNSAAWVEWTNANVTDYEKYAAGPNGSLTSTNGAGQYYGCSANGNAAIRGGAWDNGAYDGPFTLFLNDAPALVYTNRGFRCAR